MYSPGNSPSKEVEAETSHLEYAEQTPSIAYHDSELEPQLHWRTYVALTSMCILQFVLLSALLGPPSALTTIGRDLDAGNRRNWIVNVTTLCQAGLGPILASASDIFQSRKTILVASTTLGMTGSAIAPGSKDIYRLIGAQIMVGLGLAAAPLAYTVPSEIMPRRWRPVTQGLINSCGSIGTVVAPLIVGALTRSNPSGWRTFYWIQTGLWGAAAMGLLLGYNPPKRHSGSERLSFWQKMAMLDVIGAILLVSGATLFIVGLNLGGGQFRGADGHVLGPLVSGLAVLIAFGAYETWGTKIGILHHELFRGATRRQRANFSIFCILFFCEGAIFFATAVWYPVIIATLFETDTLLQAVNILPIYVAGAVGSIVYGYASSRYKSVRWPLLVGFFIWTCGVIGQATVQPGEHAIALGTGVLVGFGLAGPLVLILAGTHLSVPQHLIGTASAAVVSSRALGATIFTALYGAVVGNRLENYIPNYISRAVLTAGLPPTSIGPFIGALTTYDFAALPLIPGVTPQVIGAGVAALKQAYADGIRIVYYIAAPVAFVAVLLVPFLMSLKDHMDYSVEAPVEVLHEKGRAGGRSADA